MKKSEVSEREVRVKTSRKRKSRCKRQARVRRETKKTENNQVSVDVTSSDEDSEKTVKLYSPM